MPTLHLSDSLLDGYVALFDQLEPQDQTILLNKLTELMKKNAATLKNGPENKVFLPKPANAMSLGVLAGSWEDERSAEEIIEDLRRSRTPNPDRVNFD